MDEQNTNPQAPQQPEPVNVAPVPEQPKQQSADQPKTGHEKNTGMAVIAYIIFFIPLLTSSKNDPFVKFHVKQGLVLLITAILVSIVCSLPLIGWLLYWPLEIALIVLFVMGIINAVNGEMKKLPVIGDFESYFKF